MKRLIPILTIGIAALLGAYFLRDYINFETLSQNRHALMAFRNDHFLLTSVLFVVAYFLIVAFSLPGAAVASITGGFLFGLGYGTFLNVLAATAGASAIFMAVKYGFGDALTRKLQDSTGTFASLMQRLRENEINVLFMLRLVPIVPFFVANVLPAMVGVGLRNFVFTTFFGIIPGGLVFTWIGVGIGDVFDRGGTADLSIIWSPHILGPLLGLAALAALPMFLKKGGAK